jgi:hypothetical protein
MKAEKQEEEEEGGGVLDKINRIMGKDFDMRNMKDMKNRDATRAVLPSHD